MSVRTPATEEQKKAAEQAYRDIEAGKLKLVNGFASKLQDRFNPYLHLDSSILLMTLTILTFTAAVINLSFGSLINPVLLLSLEVLNVLFLVGIFVIALKDHRQLKLFNHYLTDISSGIFDNDIQSKGNSLLSNLFGRLKSLQIKLGADFDDVKASLNNSKRVESALNATSTNIMVVDKFQSIIFMNDSVKEMLGAIETDLQQDLPDFDCNNLLRQNIDIFHKHPEHQRGLIDKLTETYSARIVVGGVTLDLVVNPIFGDDGSRLGTVVEWKDMTAQLMIEDDISQIVANASQGQLSSRLDPEMLTGFEKKLAYLVNDLLGSFTVTSQTLNDILSNMSDGDMTNRLEGDFIGELLAMKYAVNNALNNIEITLGQVKGGAQSIGKMSNEVAAASVDLSDRTQQQAASVEETAASIEELTSTVQQSTENTEIANKLAKGAAIEAEEGITVMNQTLDAMKGITDLSRQIGEITSVIDSIAFQTNLLALNAAVEAARAGEHGRGFAVVAGEVRNLAQKSANAAKDISTLIGSTTQQIEEGTDLVEKTNSVFEGLVDKIKEVESRVGDIASTSSEQNKGLDQINIAMGHLDQSTQANAALVEELSVTATNMSEQSDQQVAFIGKFKISSEAQKHVALSGASIDFADAKMKHISWLTKLEQLFAGQTSSLDIATVGNDEACPLGKWLYGIGGQKYSALSSMQALIKTHAEFHATVARAMDACAIGDQSVANKEKDRVEVISQQVILLIDQIADEVSTHDKEAFLQEQKSKDNKVSQAQQSKVKQVEKSNIVQLNTPEIAIRKVANGSSENWNEF